MGVPRSRAENKEAPQIDRAPVGAVETPVISYIVLCAVLGLALGWLPMLVHGPIPYKYSVLGIDGGTAVWGWYIGRLLIGLLVGITAAPARWYLRGPVCGLLLLFPLSLVSLATPGCEAACMFWNNVTAMAIGFAVAGIAFALTRRHHA
jgi:hypothetical protein